MAEEQEKEGDGAQAQTRLLRRIAKATRLSGGGLASNVAKRSATGRVSATGKRASGAGKRASGLGKKTKTAPRKRPSATGKAKRRPDSKAGALRARRSYSSDVGATKPNNTGMIVAAVVTVLVGLIIGAIALNS